MATVHVTLGREVANQLPNRQLPVESSQVVESQTLDAATTDTSTIAASVIGQIWTLDIAGGSVWVAFGGTPDPSEDPRRRLPEGLYSFKATAIGETVAVLDVA
jgi:hypothetical protein